MGAKNSIRRIINIKNSSRGKNIVLFLIFLVISAGLWFVMTINDEFQREIEIPVEISELPDSITLLSPTPRVISASVKARGNTLLRYEWGDVSPIRIRYKDFSKIDGRMVMGENQIVSVLRSYFGSSSQIISAKPDSIAISYTTRPGKRVPLRLQIKATPDPNYVLAGQYILSTDSVTLYAASDIPRQVTEAVTLPAKYDGLSDTTTVNVRVNVPAGMRAIPDVVRVTIPVEPLIAKSRVAPIEVRNVPNDKSVVTFPSQVTVTYLLPMSRYKNENHLIKVYADYNSIISSPQSAKLPLEPLELPAIYHSATIALDSVEYVIEQK